MKTFVDLYFSQSNKWLFISIFVIFVFQMWILMQVVFRNIWQITQFVNKNFNETLQEIKNENMKL